MQQSPLLACHALCLPQPPTPTHPTTHHLLSLLRSQARQPTCPMCQAAIRLRVSYRMPFASGGQGGGAGGEAEGGLAGEGPGGRGPGAAGEEGGIPGIQALVRALQVRGRSFFLFAGSLPPSLLWP